MFNKFSCNVGKPIKQKKHAVCSSLEDLHQSLSFLVIKKIFLKHNLCSLPYDHHVFYSKLVTESVKRAGEVKDAITDVIYTHKNLSSLLLYFAREDT